MSRVMVPEESDFTGTEGAGSQAHFQEWQQRKQAESMMEQQIQAAQDAKAMQIASMVEAAVDDQIKDIDDMGDAELEAIRKRRIAQMRAKQRERQHGKANGHGKLLEITDQKQFFAEVKTSDRVVASFYTKTNTDCAALNAHLAKLAPAHMETKFVSVDAEKSPFLVENFKIWMMPTILLIHKNKVGDSIHGLDQLGGRHFSTAALEKRIADAKMIDGRAFEEELEDEFDPDFDLD